MRKFKAGGLIRPAVHWTVRICMTELAVALDGPWPLALLRELRVKADVTWFKIGPMALASLDWPWLVDAAHYTSIFLDLKLIDTSDTVWESVKRFADAGIAAVSTCGLGATEVALKAADGRIKIWQWVWPSDKDPPTENDDRPIVPVGLHGVVVPGYMAGGFWRGMDVVVPGVRWGDVAGSGGHLLPIDPRKCREIGATHAVVGRPIWGAPFPIASAKAFIEALRGSTS